MVTQAAKKAGIARLTAYRRRERDERFAQVWADVEEASTEKLEHVAVERAVEKSDTLLMFILRSRRPSVYRENIKVDHTVSGVIQHQLELLEGRQPVEVEGSNRRQAARLLLEAPESAEGRDSAPRSGASDETLDGRLVGPPWEAPPEHS